MDKLILIVDDDDVVRLIIENLLASEGYVVTSFESPKQAFHAFEPEKFSCVLSDYFMPEMDGEQFLREIRELDPFVPFIFLTVNSNIRNAVALIKQGADDYIPKPIVKEDLLFRIAKTIEDKETRRYMEQVAREKEILDLENRRLVNWRTLYASKDVRQTEQLIRLLSRTINQSGGFLWVDLLETEKRQLDGGAIAIPDDLYTLIMSASKGQKEVFDYIAFISNLETMALSQESIPVDSLRDELRQELEEIIFPWIRKYSRIPLFVKSELPAKRKLFVDREYLKRMLHELAVNAVKYSPEQSRILFLVEENAESGGRGLSVVVRNTPRKMEKTDDQGRQITGIPYEYSELVFDLFYTIESFPHLLEEEEWKDGTGLYVCRKLLRRQGGWISTANGIDYTGDVPEAFVKFTITLPYRE